MYCATGETGELTRSREISVGDVFFVQAVTGDHSVNLTGQSPCRAVYARVAITTGTELQKRKFQVDEKCVELFSRASPFPGPFSRVNHFQGHFPGFSPMPGIPGR